MAEMATADVEPVMADPSASSIIIDVSPAADLTMADDFAHDSASKSVPSVEIMEGETRDHHERVPKAPKSYASKPRRLRGEVGQQKSNAVPSIYPDNYQGPVSVESHLFGSLCK